MKVYHTKDDANPIDEFLKTIEEDTGKKIFTMKILNHPEEGLESVIVFEDKTVLYGLIKAEAIDGHMALRLQGNWI